jgi:hypothetical protein
MGHIRLGTIPKSQPWQAVVNAVAKEHIAGSGGPPDLDAGIPGDGVDTIALAATTLDAAATALQAAINDDGLRFTVYLLTQLSLAARSDNWLSALDDSGIHLRNDSSLFDLTSAFQESVDRYVSARGIQSDFSELAQKAAGEVLCDLAADRSQTLFGNTGEELRHAIRPLSTKTGFGQLGQHFFGRFLAYFLNFYISRISAAQIGSQSIPSLGAISKLDRTLAEHCYQSAAILRDFAGEWYSKTNFEPGIDLAHTGGFVAVAVAKLQAELKEQEAGR